MRRVEVNASRKYDILIGRGLLEQAGARIAQVIKPCTAALIADDTVSALYADETARSLEQAGFRVCRFVFPHGETSKNLAVWSEIMEFLAQSRLSRSDVIVALGGGVTGDMAGFAAASYARGIRFVQIPTTLLAAVDSSVGGKTAVNLSAAKNMAGAFWQPSLVLIDCGILEKLPEELVSDGAAEIIKYGVLADGELFELLRRGQLMSRLEEVVEKCVTIKRDLVAEDEFDVGRRQLLNLGHTLGHAVEELSGYTVTHGQAVAIGMTLMARAAWRMAVSESDLTGAVRQACEQCGLPTASPYPLEALAQAALLDKKRRGGRITLVVPERIGSCKLMDMPTEEMERFVRAAE